MATRRSAGAVASGASAVRALLPLPRSADVTCARCALLGGENTVESRQVPPGSMKT